MFVSNHNGKEYCFYDDHMTIDGVALEYSRMTDIAHKSGETPAIVFSYDGQRITMPYNKEDYKTVLPFFIRANKLKSDGKDAEAATVGSEATQEPQAPAEPEFVYEPEAPVEQTVSPETPEEPEFVYEPEAHVEQVVSPEVPAEPEFVYESQTPVEQEVYAEPEGYTEPAAYEEPQAPAEQEVYAEPEAYAEPAAYEEPQAPAEQEVYTEPEAYAEPAAYEEPQAPVEQEVYAEPEAYAEPVAYEEPQTPVEQEAYVEPGIPVDAPAETTAEQQILTEPQVQAAKASKIGGLFSNIKGLSRKKLIIIAAIVAAIIIAICAIVAFAGNSVDGISGSVKTKAVTTETGDEIKMSVIDDDVDVDEYALNYYESRFKEGDTVHWIYNKARNQTILFSDQDGTILICVYEHVDGDQEDPSLLGMGSLEETWLMYPDTGEVIKV